MFCSGDFASPLSFILVAFEATDPNEHPERACLFAVKSPILVKLMLWIIIIGELAAGLLAGKGAIDLFRARKSSSEAFNAAKTYALAGTGLAVVIWFGIFGAFGGAFFQMWQVEAGVNALRDASFFALQHGMVWLIIRSDD